MDYTCLNCKHEFSKASDRAWKICPKCHTFRAVWSDSSLVKGAISTPVVPAWRKYEAGMHMGTVEQQLDSAEKFTTTREKEVRSSNKIARWEKSRVESMQRQKPAWRKKRVEDLKSKGL